VTDKARRRDGTEMTQADLLRQIRRLLIGVVVGGLVLGGAVVWGFVRQDRTNERLAAQSAQIVVDREAAAKASCDGGDQVRALIRQIGKDVGITSGVTGGEAIIEIAPNADPAVVAAYRAALPKLLDPALTGIVNTLPGRHWDAKTGRCVDVPLDTGG